MYIRFEKIAFVFVVFLVSCTNGKTTDKKRVVADGKTIQADTLKLLPAPAELSAADKQKVYGNDRFQDVTVKKTGEHLFLIKGRAKVYQAAFSWIAEDGHNVLKKGFAITNAGLLEWGNFIFTADVQKRRNNSTVTLTMFEASSKENRREGELTIVLY